LAAPEQIGGYRVDRLLGAGGNAEVYLATDDRLARPVAIKLLAADADEDARARFVREGQALAMLQHEHVVQVLAAGDDGGRAYMVLQYVGGSSLADLMGGRPLDEETACGLLAQAARGLAAVHAIGVVHRDVKPDNLLVDDDAVVKLADFGTAVGTGLGHDGFRTKEGVAVGTPHFMSPEQARGLAADSRTDLWGLGATLYAALCGRPPFFKNDNEPDMDILARIVRDAPPDVRQFAPTISADTAALVTRLLAMERADRPVDALQVATLLDTYGRLAGQTTTPPWRRRWIPAVVAIATVVVTVVVTVSMSSTSDAVVSDAGVFTTTFAAHVDAGSAVVAVVAMAPPDAGRLLMPTVVQRFVEKPTPQGARLVLAEEPTAQREVWQGSVTAVRLWTIAAVQERRSLDLVEEAALKGSVKVASAVIDGLKVVRNDLSIQLLDQVSRGHADAGTRRRAAAARQELFRVDED
jgi:Protein kinase domain